MGNDGGSIPTRRELVKNAARNPNTSEVKASQIESQTHAWTYCPLSNRPLSEPIVSDCAGVLYNKDAVLEFLLPSTEGHASAARQEQEDLLAGRLGSMRDVVEVHFQTEIDAATRDERRVCPVTSKVLGANTRAVYLVPCGHAFADAAVREIGSDACLTCNETFRTENVISILPLAKEDVATLAGRMKNLRDAGLTHSLKKAPGQKKRKKQAEADVADVPEATSLAESDKTFTTTGEKSHLQTTTKHDEKSTLTPLTTSAEPSASPTPAVTIPASRASNGIKNAATASLTAKVLVEQEERNKRRKLGLNDNLKSLFSNKPADGAHQTDNFMTRGFSIPKKV